jgi:hypothetical protein
MSLSQTQKTLAAPVTAGTADSNTKSVTYYQGNVNEEKSDYTVKYAGTLAIDWTYYYYGISNLRAISANVNDAMKLSQTQKTLTAPGVAGTATVDTKSVTYYQGNVNEEKSDYTVKYAGTTTVDWTYYYYGATNVRASTASANDAMRLSQTQYGDRSCDSRHRDSQYQECHLLSGQCQ